MGQIVAYLLVVHGHRVLARSFSACTFRVHYYKSSLLSASSTYSYFPLFFPNPPLRTRKKGKGMILIQETRPITDI